MTKLRKALLVTGLTAALAVPTGVAFAAGGDSGNGSGSTPQPTGPMHGQGMTDNDSMRHAGMKGCDMNASAMSGSAMATMHATMSATCKQQMNGAMMGEQ